MRLKNGDVCLHKKTGSKYRIVVVANKNSGREGFPKMVVYISMNDGEIYARPYSEFVEKFVNLSKPKVQKKSKNNTVLEKLKSESQSLCALRKNALGDTLNFPNEVEFLTYRIKSIGKSILKVRGDKWSI